MELDLLDKKIRRLVCKLKKHHVALEVFDHEDIEYGEVLGKGGEGIVQRCTVTYNGLPVDAAVKTVLDNSDDSISITLDEIELLCLGKDPIMNTTLDVYGVAAVPDDKDPDMGHLVIVIEAGLMNALQLYQKEDIPLHVTYGLWSRIAAAVHVLHSKKIMHQDLKPENILITGIVRDEMGHLQKVDFKIIDLGMGKRVFTEKVVTDEILGTNGYHPPEILFEDSYDFRADVFMLGVTFCIMLLSRSFLKSNLKGLLRQLHTAKKTKRKTGKSLYESVLEEVIQENHTIATEIKKILCQMLEKQSKRGISLVKVVAICREEACRTEVLRNQMTPGLSPCSNCQSPQDSGICSGNDQSSSNGSRNSTLRSFSQSVQKVRLRGKRRSPRTGRLDADDGRNNKRKASCDNDVEIIERTNLRAKRVKRSSTYT